MHILSGSCVCAHMYFIWQPRVFIWGLFIYYMAVVYILSGKCVCGHFIWQPRVFYAAVMYFYLAVVCIVICILSDNRVYFIWQLCIFYLAVTCILSGSRMYSVVYPVSSLQMYVIIFSG
jgi:hypothetical protein